MRSVDQIKSDIADLRMRLSELSVELGQAELAECRVPFRVGQLVVHRGKQYQIGHIEPWGRDNASLKGYRIKNDGTPSKRLVYISSALSIDAQCEAETAQ